jgi:hypothetical protein
VKIKLEGKDQVALALRLLGPRSAKAVAVALFKEANAIMNKAKEVTPVDTSTLKNSGHVKVPEIKGSKVSKVTVTLGFGGAAKEYAIKVHEDLNAYHKPPTQAKFLERPFLEAEVGMADRVAQELWLQLK